MKYLKFCRGGLATGNTGNTDFSEKDESVYFFHTESVTRVTRRFPFVSRVFRLTATIYAKQAEKMIE